MEEEGGAGGLGEEEAADGLEEEEEGAVGRRWPRRPVRRR